MLNPTLRKSLYLLAHPLSLAAMALLALNDHLLRLLWPSWLTGKIGDFAWLFFIPYASAALLALAARPQGERSQRRILLLAYLLTGGLFAVLKTIPAAHAAWLHLSAGTFGLPLRTLLDPGDLIALLALYPSWRLWHAVRQPQPEIPPLAPAALVLAALLTVANSAGPDYGVHCLAQKDGYILTSSMYGAFRSYDGGISWQEVTSVERCDLPEATVKEVSLESQGLTFRIAPGVIDVSSDGGQTWQNSGAFQAPTQSDMAFYAKVRQGSPVVKPGPLDALVDPATGNVVFAMGHEGVLVRRADGTWAWAAVGAYRRERVGFLQRTFTLLGGELALAGEFGLLLFCLLVTRLHRTWLRWVVLALAAAAWALAAYLLPPALSNNYENMMSMMIVGAAAVIVVLLGVESAYRFMRHSPGTLGRALLLGLAAAAAFFLPYLLWSANVLPRYWLAALFALALGVAVSLAAWRSMGTHNL